jgi:hypothetical protein
MYNLGYSSYSYRGQVITITKEKISYHYHLTTEVKAHNPVVESQFLTTFFWCIRVDTSVDPYISHKEIIFITQTASLKKIKGKSSRVP